MDCYTVHSIAGHLESFTPRRTSKIRFLSDQPGSTTARLTARLAAATGWQLHRPFSQENYQVMNYGPGGQISPHMDQLDDDLQSEVEWEGVEDPVLYCCVQVERARLETRGGPRLATAMLTLHPVLHTVLQ